MVFESLKRRLGFLSAGQADERPSRQRPRVVLADDLPIYVIGDVHGQFDLLRDIEQLIAADAADLKTQAQIVLVGDLIDRGPESAGIIDHVIARQRGPFPWVYLLGNHEEQFLEFLSDPSPGSAWLQHGGVETLLSYGVDDSQLSHRRDLERSLAASIPDDHIQLLRELPIAASNAGYFVCHAGVVPGRSLPQQSDDDLLWYRDKMRADYEEFSETIVHGHSIVPEVIMTAHRINVDIGAYATGRLAAVRLSKSFGDKVFTTEHRGRRATLD